MVLETLNPVLSNYFLNPAGLIALSALIPLIIFYLIKKDPEKQVMPSFMFFQDQDKSESTSQAFQKIARNLILLFHILAITAFAAAFAEPYLEAGGQPENAVLILDRSGSMGDLENAKEFLTDNLGEQNSVIVVDEGSRVIAEEVSDSRAETVIEKVEPAQTETNIISGLEKIQRFEGSVFVASDLDQTVDSREPDSILQNFQTSSRQLKIMETSRRNRHGVVGIDVRESETLIDVKNFEDQERTIELTHGSQTEQVTVEGSSVQTVSFESREGRNTVELPQDDFQADNTAYYYIPEERDTEVALIADQENRYLSKTFELINFTSINYYSTPVEQEVTADIYIIGETDELDSDTVGNIEEQVKSGSNLVLFGNNGFSNLGFQELPVEDLGQNLNTTVTIKKPVETSLGEMEIREVQKTSGETYSAGSNALIKSNYGKGEFLLYNINDQRFRTNFLYPIFWKEIAVEMTGKPSIDDANRQTGNELNRESIKTPDGKTHSGRHELMKTGFYETSTGTVAVNMLSEDESLRNPENYQNIEFSGETTELPLQNHLILLILILVLIELGYLYQLGDLR